MIEKLLLITLNKKIFKLTQISIFFRILTLTNLLMISIWVNRKFKQGDVCFLRGRISARKNVWPLAASSVLHQLRKVQLTPATPGSAEKYFRIEAHFLLYQTQQIKFVRCKVFAVSVIFLQKTDHFTSGEDFDVLFSKCFTNFQNKLHFSRRRSEINCVHTIFMFWSWNESLKWKQTVRGDFFRDQTVTTAWCSFRFWFECV